METKVVWPRLNVFWFSKDDPTEHSIREKKKQTGEDVGRQEWTVPAQLGQLKTGQGGK